MKARSEARQMSVSRQLLSETNSGMRRRSASLPVALSAPVNGSNSDKQAAKVATGPDREGRGEPTQVPERSMRLTNRDEPSQSADTRNNTETPRNGASAHARVGVRERAKERERSIFSNCSRLWHKHSHPLYCSVVRTPITNI